MNSGTQSHALLLGVFERRLVCLLDILVRSLTCAKHYHDAASTYQATRHGTAVEEDPITLIITPRSLRIIDRLVKKEEKKKRTSIPFCIFVNDVLEYIMATIILQLPNAFSKRHSSLFRFGFGIQQTLTCTIDGPARCFQNRLAGETVFKFLLPNITFATSSKGSKHDTFGCVVHNERLGITNCHLFFTPSGAGAALGQAVASAISEYQRRFGGISMSGNPWEVMPVKSKACRPNCLNVLEDLGEGSTFPRVFSICASRGLWCC